jgi:RNA polymerase sigma-70 factor, ECF subfamily
MTAAMAEPLEPLEPARPGAVEAETQAVARPQLNVLQGGLAEQQAQPVEQARTANGRPVPAPAPLEQYVAAAVAGDEVARDKLLQEIRPLVLRYCRARLGRQESVIGSAEDVAQDVCVAVLAALPGYTVKGLSFRAFVYGIAAHKVTDTFRAIGRNKSEPVADVPDTGVVLDGPEHQALMAELNTRLGGLLTVLTERQREVLVLRVVVGLSAEETAQTVGSTPGAVRVTQHRALARLRGLVTGGASD